MNLQLLDRVEQLFLHLSDNLIRMLPQPVPDKERLRTCKIVSHRGEHDQLRVENTIPAFERAGLAGVWGIEFDVRWTKDLVPVVFHDATLRRIFGDDAPVNALRFDQLRSSYPLIPTLAEVVEQFGKTLHLMIELKEDHLTAVAEQNETLKRTLGPLSGAEDYHMLSLSTRVPELITFAPPRTYLPIARLNVLSVSRMSLENRYGGINLHYAFLTKKRIKRHRLAHQQVGVGYVKTKNSLFREINRGVDWIFSNHAAKLQLIASEISGR
ncbi:MAG: glycerophosphodiester phosphodiesterase [Desulfobacteraceae bacterium]|nr:glycerophosphodiester phosphodiesterase [Desulfobacteraceae bacterium]